MLVLTRKPGEKIILGNHYEVEIAAVQHGVVKFIFNVDQPVTLMPGNIGVDVDGGGELSRIAVTRKVDDSVVIGDDPASSIEVLVVSVKGEAVRVGIKAPREVQVHREEVWRLIQESNIEAARAAELDAAQLEELLGPKRSEETPQSGATTDSDAEPR
jgi:carbon storage regulator